MNLIDQQNSLVIDVTYNCNAKCHYCQWGNNLTPGRVNLPNDQILFPKSTLMALSTERIVFSGGEPLLRSDLEQLIAHYKKTQVASIVVITNGILLTEERLRSLTGGGMTGVTFSIDSVSPEIVRKIRAYTSRQIGEVTTNFEYACSQKQILNLELGVNVVVSSANLIGGDLESLIAYLNQFPLDWIKFQPVFDDGYVGSHAPELLLKSDDAETLRLIGTTIVKNSKCDTNPIEFWESLADTLNGKQLAGSACGLDSRQAIAQRGEIKICPWIEGSRYEIGTTSVETTRQDFAITKSKCKTGMFCHCLQNLSHVWKTA